MAKGRVRWLIQHPYKVTFELWIGGHLVQRSSVINSKTKALRLAKNLRALGYRVKTKALKRPYPVR